MQILPSHVLSAIVKHFLIIENETVGLLRHRMFSDGNTGLVFNYGDALLLEEVNSEANRVLPPSFIYGQLDHFQNIISAGKIGMLIVVFHPYGASQLLKVPAIELKNLILDLDHFYPGETENIIDQILNSSDSLAKINIAEDFLTRKIDDQSQNSGLANQAITIIHQHKGNIPVAQLTSVLQISERKLQRTFEEHIGLSPKRYSGVVRIQFFLKLLRKSPSQSLTGLTYDAGFYDQAHLIREMKNISGITPGQYVGQTALLAANLLQLPTL